MGTKKDEAKNNIIYYQLHQSSDQEQQKSAYLSFGAYHLAS
jgi:hypothetical protein